MEKTLYRILIVGSDGRMHALFTACCRTMLADLILAAPGNGGIHRNHRRNVGVMDFAGLVELCKMENINLVIVSPEAPLVGADEVGIVDYFKEHAPDVMVFGPSARAARLEGSKIFCYQLAEKYGVRMPKSEVVHYLPAAGHTVAEHIAARGGIVVKEDGLASGKGVTVARSDREAFLAVERAYLKGGAVLLQEMLMGPEASFICFSDGKTVRPLRLARDFKRAYDDDEGANTGGMGSYAPLPEYPTDGPVYAQMLTMAEAMVDACAAEGHPYIGLLYLGVMVVDGVVYLIEINCRGGDPEMEAILMGLSSDFVEYVVACCTGTLDALPVPHFYDGAAVCVVVASEGYPGDPKPQGIIPHEWLIHMDGAGVDVYHAGTKQVEGGYTPTGGRVLMPCARAATPALARKRIYDALNRYGPPFPGAWWRKDIALGV